MLLKPVREQPLFEALVNVIIGKKPELNQPVKIVGDTAFVRAALQKSLRRWAGSGNIWPMLSQVCSAAVSGIDAYPFDLFVIPMLDFGSGDPGQRRPVNVLSKY